MIYISLLKILVYFFLIIVSPAQFANPHFLAL